MKLHRDRLLTLTTGAFLAIALLLMPEARLLGQSGDKAKKAPKVGLILNDPRAYAGYTLFAPLMSTKTYLIDMQGKVVHTWTTNCNPGASAYFLENGHLLRTGTLMGEEKSFGGGPGAGGRVQEIAWDGSLVWDFKFFNSRQLPHHDVTRMPNGNVLMIVWDKKTPQEALAAGRRPELNPDNHLLPDSILEVKPTGKTTGAIVWEWHLWDHLVQDFDKSKANYGSVADHPELVNINFGEDALAPAKTTKDQQDKLKSIGYVGAATPNGRQPRRNPDWTHCNGLAYNPELDQVIISVHGFSEFWIIDHSTTTKEAAGHTGGRSGKGGDLLYRFGNPLAYRAGTKKDQKLFAQHNAHWIAPGLPGAGHVVVFNNGNERPDGNYSSVDELALPVDAEGKYARDAKGGFEPAKLVWSYTAPKKSDFYSFFISGAQRLPNGHTLICAGSSGTFFEVTPDHEVVWKYANAPSGSGAPPFAPPRPGQVLPDFVQDMLQMSAAQKKQLGQLQKDVDGQLDRLLKDDQKKRLKEPAQGGGPEMTGEVLSKADRDRLKLTEDQKKQLGDIQKEVDDSLAQLLKDDQKKQLQDMKKGRFPGQPGPGGPPQGGPGRNDSQLGQLLIPPVQDQLKLSAKQKKELADFQKKLTAQLDSLLSTDQKDQLKKSSGGSGRTPQPGQVLSSAQQASLKLSAEQRKEVRALQKEADGKLAEMLSAEQKKQLKEIRANPDRVARGGGGGGGPGGPPNMQIAVFRAYRFAASFPGLAGKELKPGKTLEELLKEKPKKAAR